MPHGIIIISIQGTIEEKIFQRQISKQGLNSVVDLDNSQVNENGSVKFSTEELKDLFTLCHNTSCETHDLLSCRCGEKKVSPTCVGSQFLVLWSSHGISQLRVQFIYALAA